MKNNGMIFAIFKVCFIKYGDKLMKSKNKNYKIPKQIKAILDYKSKISKKSGREISFSEALSCWLAYGYGDQFIENHFFKK